MVIDGDKDDEDPEEVVPASSSEDVGGHNSGIEGDIDSDNTD
jgi:hypothetical protein